MKIIHLVLGKANPDRMNGVNKVAHNLAAFQFRRGHDVEIWGITPTPEDVPRDREYPIRLFKRARFRFTLGAALAKAIDALDTGVRGGPEPDAITLETFGREIPEA